MNPSTAMAPLLPSRSEAADRRSHTGRRWAQVALTYLYRREFWAMGLLLIGITGFANYASPQLLVWRELTGELAGMMIGMSVFSIAIHLRQQLDDWRSSLVPGFRGPHFLVAGAMTVMVTGIFSLLLYVPLGVSATGLFAVLIVLSTALAWLAYEPMVPFLLALACGLDAMHIGENFASFIAGKYPVATWMVIAAGAASLALLGKCLAGLRGEGALLNSTNIDLHYRQAMSGKRAQQFGPLTRFLLFLAGRIDEAVNRWPPRVIAPLRGKLSRSRHREMAMVFRGSAALAGSTLGLGLVIVVYIATLFIHEDIDPKNHPLTALLMYPAITAMTFPPVGWPTRWPYLAMESLLPASRHDFIRETGIALGRELLIFWICSMGVELAAMALFFPVLFRAEIASLLVMAGVSGASLPLVFGVSLWATRLRNAWVSSAGTFLIVLSPLVVAMRYLESPHPRVVEVVLASLALALVGMVLALDAHRRWRRTELG